MSRFWREGHFRTSKWGDTHWVEGHWVDRSDWGRWSYAPPPPPHHSRANVRAMLVPASSTSDGRRANFTTPNAACPVCGARVFFYQNEHGSRVYFDSLGPPWPKHPCTDHPRRAIPREMTPAVASPARPAPTVANQDLLAARLAESRSTTSASAPVSPVMDNGNARHLAEGWTPYSVVRRSHRVGLTYFVVRKLTATGGRRLRFSVATRDDLPGVEDTIYIRELRLSFFSFELLEPVELDIALKIGKSTKVARRKARRKRRKRA